MVCVCVCVCVFVGKHVPGKLPGTVFVKCKSEMVMAMVSVIVMVIT